MQREDRFATGLPNQIVLRLLPARVLEPIIHVEPATSYDVFELAPFARLNLFQFFGVVNALLGRLRFRFLARSGL